MIVERLMRLNHTLLALHVVSIRTNVSVLLKFVHTCTSVFTLGLLRGAKIDTETIFLQV